ncbi:hypothetical protein E4U61_003498 [Claviceps capensis]|nr:hypothetical protein E4U61_003498 [Claviceps capensis]
MAKKMYDKMRMDSGMPSAFQQSTRTVSGTSALFGAEEQSNTSDTGKDEDQKEKKKVLMWVEGSNIGASANEPKWTKEQTETINAASMTKLPIKVVNDTRRVVPDQNNVYVTLDNKGAAVTREGAFLNKIPTTKYVIGMGKAKGDQKTGKIKLYSDLVMKGRGRGHRGRPEEDLGQGPKGHPHVDGTREERRIGHDFARIGLPKMYFGPLFETLRSKYPKILDGISTTVGYYWLNASWGVTGNPGKYRCMIGAGKMAETQKLSEVMRIFNGKSSLCQATIAISTAFTGKLSGSTIVKDGDACDMSIKVHNAFHIKTVDYRSPPQSSSTGFELTEDLRT